jgi:hypothetical protein
MQFHRNTLSNEQLIHLSKPFIAALLRRSKEGYICGMISDHGPHLTITDSADLAYKLRYIIIS